MRTEQIFYEWQGSSNMGQTVGAELERLIELVRKQAQVVEQLSAEVEIGKAKEIAAIREAAAVNIEIAKQTSTQVRAELAERTVATKAAEDRMTATHKAAEAERTANAAAAARQATAAFIEAQRQQKAALDAANAQQLVVVKAGEAEKLAAIKAGLRASQSAQDAADRESLLATKENEARKTATHKAELNEQTLILKAELQQQTNAMKAESQQQLAEMRKTRSGIDSITSGLRDMRTILGASFSLYEVYEFGRQIIDAKSKVDTFKLGLTQMLGSKREMNELYVDIVRLANETPFEVESLFDTVFNLKGMGVASKELIPTLEALGNMSAVAGQEKLPLIAKAFTDVMNKGKLMKQELNQFAENGIPLYDLLADSMNKPREAVIKLAEAHDISFDQVKKAIMDATSEGGRYYRMMNIQAETLSGQMSNLSDRFFIAKAVLGDYYENGLQRIITGLKNTVIQLAGSDAAIRRTSGLVEAAALLWGAWTLANSRFIASLTAKKIVMAEAAALTTLYTATVGTFNLVMITATGYTDLFSAAQVRSAVAARQMWLSLAANPIGLVIGLVGTAVAAYGAWKAMTIDVTEGISDQMVTLEKERKTMAGSIEDAIRMKQGTEGRKQAIQDLINRYPEYFKGMDAERVTNAQLRQMLEQVNTSFRTRIALAKEAYRAEASEDRYKDLVKKELEIMAIAEQRLGKTFMIQFDGDPAKLLKALESSTVNMKKFSGGMVDQFDQIFKGYSGGMMNALRDVVSHQGDYERETAQHEKRIKELKTQSAAEAIATEQKKHAAILAQLKAANDHSAKDEKEYKDKLAAENKRFEDAMIALKGEAIKKKEKAEEDHGGKLKTITLNSGAAIKKAQLEIDEDTHANRLKKLAAEEKLEIESANKILVSKKASEAEIQSATAASLEKIKAIRAKYNDLRKQEEQRVIDILMASATEYVSIEEEAAAAVAAFNTKTKKQIIADAKEAAQERKKSAQEIAQEVDESEKRIQAAHKETAQIQKQQAKQQLNVLLEIMGQQSGVIGQMSQSIKAVWSNWSVISGQQAEEAANRFKQAEADEAKYLNLFLAGDKEAEASAASAKARKEEARTDMSAAKAASTSAALGLAGMIINLAQQIYKALDEFEAAAWRQIAASMAKAQEAVKAFYDKSIELNREDMKNMLAVTESGYDARMKIIEKYYDREQYLLTARDKMDDVLAYNKEVSTALSEAGRQTVWNWAAYNEKMALAMIEIEKNKQLRIYQMQINSLELQKEKLAAAHEERLKQIQDELDAFKDAKNEEIDKAKEAADVAIQKARDAADATKERLQEIAEKTKETYEKNVESVKTAATNAIQIKKDELAQAKDIYNQDVENVRNAYNQQMEALKAKQAAEEAALAAFYEKKAAMLAQSTGDEVEKIGIIDRARFEALERYRTDEVARLQATRDRILATLTDEGERERVTAEYNRRIQAVHEEVEAAKLDKTKGVSLASTQLRAEEKEEALRLKNEEKAERERLDNNYQTLFKALTDERDKRLSDLKDSIEQRERDTDVAIRKIETDRDTDLRKMKDEQQERERQYKEDLKTLEKNTKDEIEKIQTELKDKITDLQNQIKAQEIKSAKDKEKANSDYADAILAINRQIFEANKAMKIAELQAEIAILESKKSWTGIGNGKINDAQNDIRAAIGQIQGTFYTEAEREKNKNDELGNAIAAQALWVGLGGGDKIRPVRVDNYQPIDSAFDENGNPMELTYNQSGKRITVYDANKNAFQVAYADGYVPATGKRYAEGTDYLQRDGHPAGVDTIPIWANEGERIISTEKNLMLGGISNDELVRRSLLFDALAKSNFSLFGGSAGIAGLLDSPGTGSDTDRLLYGLSGFWDALAAQQHVSINMDETGFRKSVTDGQTVSDYYTNLFTR